MRSTTPTGGGSPWATLGADPICRVTVLVLSLLAIPYLVPLLPRETLGAISADYFDIVLLALPLVALLYRLQRITHPEEHRFWRHLAAGIGFWIAARVFYVVWPGYEQSVPAAIVADVLILLFYMFTVQATETRPHQPPGWSASAPGYRLASTGAVAFASALLVYFAVIPSSLNPELYGSWLPSLYLFVTLDLFLLIRFTMLALACDRRRWRVLYGLCASTAALWGLTDVLECLGYANLISLPVGSPVDMLWWPPIVTLVATARLRTHRFEPADAAGAATRAGTLRTVPSPLLLLAFALPTMHLALYALGLLDEASRGAREVTVLVALAVLCALAVAHQRLLEQRTRSLESDLTTAHGQLMQAQTLGALGRSSGEKPRRLALNETVRHTQAMVRRLVADSVEIAVTLDPDVGSVLANPGQLQQVVVNLAVNAGDAMPEGGVLTIATSRARVERAALVDHLGVPPGDYVVLTVRDTGTGMEPATLTRVFEPFFTTKTPGPDTGLGLSAVVDIVRQASGAVEVESTPGHGSTFTVWLPEATPAPEPVLPRAGFEATHRLERESLGAG